MTQKSLYRSQHMTQGKIPRDTGRASYANTFTLQMSNIKIVREIFLSSIIRNK